MPCSACGNRTKSAPPALKTPVFRPVASERVIYLQPSQFAAYRRYMLQQRTKSRKTLKFT